MYDPVNRFVARRLRCLRLSKGLTCRELARKAGFPESSYSTYENGWARISLERLFQILQALGVNISEVWPVGAVLPKKNGSICKKEIEEALQNGARGAGRAGIPLESVLAITADVFGITHLQERLRRANKDDLIAVRAAGAILGEMASIPRVKVAAALNTTRTALNSLAAAYTSLIQERPRSQFARQITQARKRLEGEKAAVKRKKKALGKGPARTYEA